jgi:hypothetical protein
VNLRRDHVAGGAFVVAGALVLAVSGAYPFGTMASPGAGMMPILVAGLVMAFGIAILLRAGESPLLSTIDWGDSKHALTVVAVAAVAVGAYTQVGFLVTIPCMLFVLTLGAERRSFLWSAAFSIGVSALAYALFIFILKTPLPRSPFGF